MGLALTAAEHLICSRSTDLHAQHCRHQPLLGSTAAATGAPQSAATTVMLQNELLLVDWVKQGCSSAGVANTVPVSRSQHPHTRMCRQHFLQTSMTVPLPCYGTVSFGTPNARTVSADPPCCAYTPAEVLLHTPAAPVAAAAQRLAGAARCVPTCQTRGQAAHTVLVIHATLLPCCWLSQPVVQQQGAILLAVNLLGPSSGTLLSAPDAYGFSVNTDR
jgi:hypothetical protein